MLYSAISIFNTKMPLATIICSEWEKQCLTMTEQGKVGWQCHTRLVVVPIFVIIHGSPKVLGVSRCAVVTHCIEEAVDVTTLDVNLQRLVIRELAVLGELLGNCRTIRIVCVDNIVNPHLATIGCKSHPVQTLVQLCIGRVVVVLCRSIATLVRKPKLGTLGDITINHNVDDIAVVCIDTGRVVHITVSVDAQVACHLTLDAVGLVHLHAELLGILTVPSIRYCPQAVVCIVISVGTVGRRHGCLFPVTAIDFVDHSL